MKWEYAEMHLAAGVIQSFNRMGLDGWELVQIVGHVAYFKRRVKP